MMQPRNPRVDRSNLASLARLWELAGPLRGGFLLGILFRIAQSLCLGIAFGAVVWVVSGIAEGRSLDWRWIGQVALIMTAALAGQLLFGYLAASRSWLSSYALAGRLRLSLLARLRCLPMGFHLSRHRGDTVTALTSDMQMLEGFLSEALPRIAQAFALPVMVLGFLVWWDWAVGLSALTLLLVSVPLFLWASRELSQLGLQRQDLQAAASARMIEYAQGIAVIRAFNRIARGEEGFAAALRDFRDISIRLVVRLTTPLTLFSIVIMLGVPVVMVAAALRHENGAIDTATLIASLALVFSLYQPLLGLAAVMELARIADASLTRIDRIMTAVPLPQPQVPREPDGFAITFEAVSFGYGPDRSVLRDVGFTVPERSMTAIVGPSGAGKSTVLNLLPRFWDVDQGRVRIGGVDVRDIAEERLNGLVSVVFQDVYLFAGTLFDNIAFGRPGAVMADVVAAAQAARAHEFIMALPGGYGTRVGEGGATLSGGERQRISIARAILKDAPIVLLDEATAAIDPSNERAIQEALACLTARKTLIVVAHKLSTIQAADEILVLMDGRIVERGRHDALLAAEGSYARLCRRRQEAASWHLGRV